MMLPFVRSWILAVGAFFCLFRLTHCIPCSEAGGECQENKDCLPTFISASKLNGKCKGKGMKCCIKGTDFFSIIYTIYNTLKLYIVSENTISMPVSE